MTHPCGNIMAYLKVTQYLSCSNHVMRLLKIIIKCSDVSNEVRPETVASPWVERLFAEYSEQSAREKRECLPVTPYMDPDMVSSMMIVASTRSLKCKLY